MESYSGARFLQPGHGDPGPRPASGTVAVPSGQPGQPGPDQPRQASYNMAAIYFFPVAGSPTCARKKLISLPFEAGRKMTLSFPFPTTLNHACLLEFPCSLFLPTLQAEAEWEGPALGRLQGPGRGCSCLPNPPALFQHREG